MNRGFAARRIMDGEAGARALNASRPSSDIDFSDPAIEAAWAACKAGAAGSWIALGYANKKKLELLGTGSGGYHELLTTVLSHGGERNDRVVYAVFSFSCELPRSAHKFVFLTAIGGDVGGMAKGRASLHSSDVANAFEKHYALTVDDPDELTVVAMTKKLEQEMGLSSIQLT